MLKLSNSDSPAATQPAILNPDPPVLHCAPGEGEPVLPAAFNEGGPVRHSAFGEGGPTTNSLPGLLSNVSPAPLVPITAPVSSTEAAALVDAKPLPAPGQPRKIRRNGRIASLPKLERDMVNRMLWNAVPYKNIVAALDEAGYTVTDRNISNWATGGYLEWRLAQEHVLENRLGQDHLLDFLRRDDAPELPEVGLQAAATRLSQVFLQKLARADDPEAHLDNFSKLVDLLCRLNREITAIQKQRDDSRRSLGPEYAAARVKETEQLSAIENERFFSNPPSDSGLSGPSVPPILPPIPTASFMAQRAHEDQQDAATERAKNVLEMMKAFQLKNATCSKQLSNSAAPACNQLQDATIPAPTSATPPLPVGAR